MTITTYTVSGPAPGLPGLHPVLEAAGVIPQALGAESPQGVSGVFQQKWQGAQRSDREGRAVNWLVTMAIQSVLSALHLLILSLSVIKHIFTLILRLLLLSLLHRQNINQANPKLRQCHPMTSNFMSWISKQITKDIDIEYNRIISFYKYIDKKLIVFTVI